MTAAKTVLVVDDEVHVLRIISDKLTRSGFAVLTADSAEDAITCMKDRLPDLIVTDNQMAAMSGVELARQLFRNPQRATIPILMISSRQFEVGHGELADTNIKHVEGKPFSIRALLSRIEQLIGPGDATAPTPARTESHLVH